MNGNVCFILCTFIGGHNIRQLDPSWFRRHIGLVNQEPVLFASSIADNISYGKDGATMSEVHSILLWWNNLYLLLFGRLKKLPSRPMLTTSLCRLM